MALSIFTISVYAVHLTFIVLKGSQNVPTYSDFSVNFDYFILNFVYHRQ